MTASGYLEIPNVLIDITQVVEEVSCLIELSSRVSPGFQVYNKVLIVF